MKRAKMFSLFPRACEISTTWCPPTLLEVVLMTAILYLIGKSLKYGSFCLPNFYFIKKKVSTLSMNLIYKKEESGIV